MAKASKPQEEKTHTQSVVQLPVTVHGMAKTIATLKGMKMEAYIVAAVEAYNQNNKADARKLFE